MKDDPQIPNKQQVNVELPTAFGGKRIQQLDLQGTRTNPVSDFNWYILNQLSVPARAVDIVADILMWIAASSFLASVSNQLITLRGVSAIPLRGQCFTIAGVLLALAVFLSIYICKIATSPKVRWSLVYRWFLIVIGVFLGVR